MPKIGKESHLQRRFRLREGWAAVGGKNEHAHVLSAVTTFADNYEGGAAGGVPSGARVQPTHLPLQLRSCAPERGS